MNWQNHHILNAFSVDVEDYFQVSAFERDIRRDGWDRYESRVVANTYRILDLLERHHVQATFFVLGWVAERHPRLVREIHRRGHKIGSHTYWHRLIYQQSPEQFREDLKRSKDVLEQATGERVIAFRAPSFSITGQSRWALEILAEQGFRIDSSIFPTYHYRYGIPDAEPGIHEIATSAGSLWEFPPSVVRLAGLNIPVSGGCYFRLYPLRLTRRLLSIVNHKHRRPFVFYVHPWELDPEQPRLRASSWFSRVKHRLNLAATESRLETLFRAFRFGPVCAAAFAGNGSPTQDHEIARRRLAICDGCPDRRNGRCRVVEEASSAGEASSPQKDGPANPPRSVGHPSPLERT